MAGFEIKTRDSFSVRHNIYIGMTFRSHLSELDLAIGFGEQGMITAQTDICTGTELGATLPHDDGSRANHLTVGPLDAQPLSGAVPTVAGASAPFLVCHC